MPVVFIAFVTKVGVAMRFLSSLKDWFTAQTVKLDAYRYAAHMKDQDVSLADKVDLLSMTFGKDYPMKWGRGYLTEHEVFQTRNKVALAAAESLPTEPFKRGMAESDLVLYEHLCTSIGQAYGEAAYTVFEKLEPIQGDCATRALYALAGGGSARLSNHNLAAMVFENLKERNTTPSLILATSLARNLYDRDAVRGHRALFSFSSTLSEFLAENPAEFEPLLAGVAKFRHDMAIGLLRDYFFMAAGSRSSELSPQIPLLVEKMLDRPNPLFRGLLRYAVREAQTANDPLKITIGILGQAFSAATSVIGTQSPNPREKFETLLAQVTQEVEASPPSPRRG